MTLYYSSASLMIALNIWGNFFMCFKILFSVKNLVGNLIGIALNL